MIAQSQGRNNHDPERKGRSRRRGRYKNREDDAMCSVLPNATRRGGTGIYPIGTPNFFFFSAPNRPSPLPPHGLSQTSCPIFPSYHFGHNADHTLDNNAPRALRAHQPHHLHLRPLQSLLRKRNPNPPQPATPAPMDVATDPQDPAPQ